MPQMNPMNWVLLMILFNSIFFLVMVKVHFMLKTTAETMIEVVESGSKMVSFTKEI